jgi:D-tagatose-1,6-bisphosphate aldolase subunit GatZ/KbaZ
MNYLREIVALQKKGTARGVCSVCSAHELVVIAAMKQALGDGVPVLIEATSNQVNQFGGYTGMTPDDFKRFVFGIAKKTGFPLGRVILGGDHLGPGPFQREAALSAMEKAVGMVEAFVRAGFTKMHLDASMPLGRDPGDGHGVGTAVAAERCAELCRAAELAEKPPGTALPLYVIGTEVPVPGGSDEVEEGLRVTSAADFRRTVSLTEGAFGRLGLGRAWRRVIAVVVQPGVEYGDRTVVEYDRKKAGSLERAGRSSGGIVFEAHSTDYQPPEALKRMVEDGFAVLKVGPALTFAMREAVFALGFIERELAAKGAISNASGIFAALEDAMKKRRNHWESYYTGSNPDRSFARRYSFFDRIRYYWPDSGVKDALASLFSNLGACPPPLSLLSQFLPLQYRKVREGALDPDPEELVVDHIRDVLADYSLACGVRRQGRSSA